MPTSQRKSASAMIAGSVVRLSLAAIALAPASPLAAAGRKTAADHDCHNGPGENVLYSDKNVEFQDAPDAAAAPREGDFDNLLLPADDEGGADGGADEGADARADDAAAAAPADADGFASLFNGKDLGGWDGDKRFWSVEDGAITGRTTKENSAPGNTFLVWAGGDVRDFELKLTCRITGNNSGIQYRSNVVDPEKWVVHGYQCDFGPGESHNGKLYEEGGRAGLAYPGQKVVIRPDGKKQVVETFGDPAELKKGVPEGEWVDVEIVAEGDHLVHRINGEVVVDATDQAEGRPSGAGVLALQIHGGEPMTVQFKDIRLKRLDPAGPDDVAAAAAAGEGPRFLAWFTTDDGKTWFADDGSKIPPFRTKDGKTAVRCKVFKCGDGPPFVNHLERYSDDDKKAIEGLLRDARRGPNVPNVLAHEYMNLQKLQVKRPGVKRWVRLTPNDPEALELYRLTVTPLCAPGDVLQMVAPEPEKDAEGDAPRRAR